MTATKAICSSVAFNDLSCNSSGIEDANQPHRLLNSWHSPPSDWIKVNIDAAIHNSYKAGIRVVFRDHFGSLLLAFGRPIIHWDSAAVEHQAILTIKQVIKEWMLEYRGLIYEGDNMNVINYFKELVKNGGNNSSEISFIKDFDFVIFNCRFKTAGKPPDKIAAGKNRRNSFSYAVFTGGNLTSGKLPENYKTTGKGSITAGKGHRKCVIFL
ncbi:uncharacterized protein LOC110093777 [Dendrobium catenatum]|uniref:uncharacterized protein LOC110093777 n=1 Tax=Dendrobium catenatum TaxID=906689 RepID=UPI0009F4884F|nr:uncharacterized protein LOC110093777 [Dendrobium catenatum]